MAAFTGTLLAHHFVDRILPVRFAGRLGEDSRTRALRRVARARTSAETQLGPASSVRAVFEVGAIPLFRALGYSVAPATPDPDIPLVRSTVVAERGTRLGLIVGPWAEPLDRLWRLAVMQGIATGTRWCFCYNGRQLRGVDTERSFARRFVEFDLAAAATDEDRFAILWALARPEVFQQPRPSLFEEMVDASAREAQDVCLSLERGVRTALADLSTGLAHTFILRRPRSPRAETLDTLVEQSLTIIYRILFLLFAEARSLVPLWHPVYRDSYSIASLQDQIDGLEHPRGLWESLQAISRLAHAGCRVDDLRVVAFNGRLFEPSRTPLGEHARLTDEVTRDVLRALTMVPGKNGAGRQRITFADLGVEQLGTVYEGVLDYAPELLANRVHLKTGSSRRKQSGTFYTPRALTDYLVARTLAPLVRDLGPDDILTLRVVDPSMGSGAFLVSACTFLAEAWERASERQNQGQSVTPSDRVRIRRAIAQRCLFGVDLNPMAVQLARLSLWLTTMSADEPLTFLDHHLRVGDSLIGASVADILRRPPASAVSPSGRRKQRSGEPRPLIDVDDLAGALRSVLPLRVAIANDPASSLEAVRAKEASLLHLSGPDSPLARWKLAADLWCASWFWKSQGHSRGVYLDLLTSVLHGSPLLPRSAHEPIVNEVRAMASDQKFFHWTLEFPEVFYTKDGSSAHDPGFDAVIGNPPWDVLRSDMGDAAEREELRTQAARMRRFVHESGVYGEGLTAHLNRYQLFVDRAFALVRPGGRFGLVMPWGLASDHGSTGLRRRLLERADTDLVISFENSHGLFPIHRGVRFLIMTSTAGRPTRQIDCRFGLTDPAVLETLSDKASPRASASSAPQPVALTPAFLERLSGGSLAFPDVRSLLDVAIVERISARVPTLGSEAGWNARFGRELNATDDRRHFRNRGVGLPILEGKHIGPFRVDLDSHSLTIEPDVAARLLPRDDTFGRHRLAYRDVAAATNRQTLIAALLPPDVVTTHTLFCLRTKLNLQTQWFLCGMMNGYVANYLVRLWVGTHVTTAIVHALPVPVVPVDSSAFVDVSRLASELATTWSDAAFARLQAIAAHLYGLSLEELGHILNTFALVPQRERRDVLHAFETLNVPPSS